MRGMTIVILILSLAVSYCTAQQLCTNTQWPSDVTGFTGYSSVNTETSSGYLMEAAEYHTPDACTCGVLYKWKFVPRAAGAIQFQVWDHLNHESYQLKGENYFTVPANAVGQQIDFLVPERDRITIRNNYLLGWYGVSGGIIGYKDGDESYSDEARREPNMIDLDPSAEPIFDWSSGNSEVYPDRKYAIGAEVISNTAPEFTNLPRTVWIYGDETSGAYIYQIQADDIDSKDVSTLFIYDTTEDATSNFYYDRAAKIVFLAVSNPATGTYTMTFEVQDQCLNTNTGTLTIVVNNWAPSLTNMPSFVTLPEDTSNEVALFTIQFTDKDNTTLTNSYALNVDPPTLDIEEKYTGHDQTNRTLVSKRGASYDYTTSQQYIVDITLTDGNTNTDKGYFMVYITKNDPPKFTNLENGARANVSYESTASGDFVYAVSVTDAENDPLTFTMTCDPTECPLQIDGDNGVISTTKDFATNVYDPGWDLEITVSDGTSSVTRALTVINEGINDKPQFINIWLASDIVLYENTALGTTVFTVSFTDLDADDTHSIQAQFNQKWAINYFEMNSTTGILTTAYNILDYEQVVNDSRVSVSFKVSDGIDLNTRAIFIQIGNENEAPSFHQTKYTLEPPEVGMFGDPAGDWFPDVTDPDLDIPSPTDTHTYTWDCGQYTRYFLMEKTSGMVTFATTFDYDSVNFTSPYDCIVTVTDKAGLSATTTLEIDIHDYNDNSPVFADTEYYIFQIPSLTPGRFVGQVTATDNDRSAVNSAIYYSFVPQSASFPKDFLYINDFGNIYVNESWEKPTFDYGIKYSVVVKAENVKDTTGLVRSATVSVTLYLSGTTTTTAVTTDRPFKFIEDNRNVAWLTVVVTLGTVLLIVTCGFLLVYTIQVKRYRWCIPWCRKRLLGLSEMARREKSRYYQGLLMQEELEDLSEESEDEVVRTKLNPDHGDWDEDTEAPPMLWDRLKAGPNPVTRGQTVRKTAGRGVPRAAVYDEPKPPMKKDASKMMKKSNSNFWA